MGVDNLLSPRAKDLLFTTLEFLRKEIRPQFADWKDADDWLFSELEFTKDELQQIYEGRNELIYTGSAIEPSASLEDSTATKFDVVITQILTGHTEIKAENAAAALKEVDRLYNLEGKALPDMETVSPLQFRVEPVSRQAEMPKSQESPEHSESFSVHPSKEDVERYLISQGYPHPDACLMDEFLSAGDNQPMYDESVRNNYCVSDLDRWLHLNKIIGEPVSFRCAMMIDDALWEEEYESLEMNKKEDLLQPPEGVFKKRIEGLAADYAGEDTPLNNDWGVTNDDVVKLARAFNLPLAIAAEQKPSLSTQIESAANLAATVSSDFPDRPVAPQR